MSIVDSADKHLEVIVDDSQLSLAIGKKGQNVRLAAKLLGWKIDIKSEEEKRQEVEQQMSALIGGTSTPLESIKDELGEGIVEKLAEAGISTIEAVADMTPEELEQVPGIGPKSIEKIAEAVNDYFSRLEGTAAPAGEIAAPEESATAEESAATGLGEDSAGQSGDNADLEATPGAEAQSVNELDETGQGFEADVVEGVENAPDADEAEVHTHGEEGRDDKE